MATLVGIISDTHGLVRPEALRALTGVELILHAGDVGKPEVLDALSAIAPVVAVRGNIDTGSWAQALPLDREITVEQARLYMIHNAREMQRDPGSEGLHAVIAGHSHRPRNELLDGVLYLNPGSAGPRRFRLPLTCMTLSVSGSRLSVNLLTLGDKTR